MTNTPGQDKVIFLFLIISLYNTMAMVVVDCNKLSCSPPELKTFD
jgi:signal recognition particle receptor subunit beta